MVSTIKLNLKLHTLTLKIKITRVMHVQPDISSNSLDPKYKISKQSIYLETVKVTGGATSKKYSLFKSNL